MDMLGKNPETGKCGIIDVPPEFVSTKNYMYVFSVFEKSKNSNFWVIFSATTAHKCNHSFDPNAKFILGFHPRFGQVPSVQTLREVQANEEITVSYDYALEKAPPWYQELYAKRFLDSYLLSKKTSM